MSDIHLVMLPTFYHGRLLPPLGIACLSAFLKENGYTATCTDLRPVLTVPDLTEVSTRHTNYTYRSTAFVADIPELPLLLSLARNVQRDRPILDGFEEALLEYVQYRALPYHETARRIRVAEAKMQRHLDDLVQHPLVGFTTVVSNYFYVMLLALMLRQRKPDIKIVLGGPQVTFSANSALLAQRIGAADHIITHEGEEELLELLESRRRTVVVSGAVQPCSADHVPRRSVDIESLPVPDFSLFERRHYAPYTLPFYASRGCAYRCSFCSYHRQLCGQKYVLRSPERTVEQMLELQRTYRVADFDMYADATMNTSMPWLEKLVDELLRKQCSFGWSGFFKPWMKPELLPKLKRSGLHSVSIGAESFSDHVLGLMGKGHTSGERITETIRMFCAAGIEVHIGIIVGFPGETADDFQTTYDQLMRLTDEFPDNFIFGHQLFQLRAGSDCFDNVSDFGLTMTNWGRLARQIHPEVGDLVGDVPMSFDCVEPTLQEAIDRSILLDGFARATPDASGGSAVFEQSLENLRERSIVKVLSDGLRIRRVEADGVRTLFEMRKGKRPHLATEEEMVMYSLLDGLHTLEEVAGGGQASSDVQPALDFLRVLNEHGVGIETVRD